MGNPSKPIASVRSAGAGWTEVVYTDGTSERISGTRANRNNNPGNIEYGKFAKSMGAVGSDGRFAVFPDPTTGFKAMEGLLFNSSKYNTLSLQDAISRYAPPSENNSTRYAREVASAIGVPVDTPLSSLSPEQRSAMVSAMSRVEGYNPSLAGAYAGAVPATDWASVFDTVLNAPNAVPSPRPEDADFPTLAAYTLPDDSLFGSWASEPPAYSVNGMGTPQSDVGPYNISPNFPLDQDGMMQSQSGYAARNMGLASPNAVPEMRPQYSMPAPASFDPGRFAGATDQSVNLMGMPGDPLSNLGAAMGAHDTFAGQNLAPPQASMATPANMGAMGYGVTPTPSFDPARFNGMSTAELNAARAGFPVDYQQQLASAVGSPVTSASATQAPLDPIDIPNSAYSNPSQQAQQAAQNAAPSLVQPQVSPAPVDPRMGNIAAVDATMAANVGQPGVYGADDAPGKRGGMLSALGESLSSRMSPQSIAGALAGGAVAGPFGAVIGGLLGGQIGKENGLFNGMFSGDGFGFGPQQAVSGGTRSVSRDGNWSTFSPTGSGRTSLNSEGGPVPGLSTYDANGDGRFGGIFDGLFG